MQLLTFLLRNLLNHWKDGAAPDFKEAGKWMTFREYMRCQKRCVGTHRLLLRMSSQNS